MTIRVTLKPGTRRNTKCYWVGVAGCDMLFSYETCIAFIGAGVSLRRRNEWGPTTGRHMNESGVRSFPEAKDAEEFEKKRQEALQYCIHPALITLQELTK